jgi:hypothetical protein
MDLSSIVAGTLWRLFAWLPGWALRRFFSPQWLAQHTEIEIPPRNNPVSVVNAELPEVHLRLILRNNGHFFVELDRLTVELVFNAAIVRSAYLQRVPLAAGETRELFVRQSLTAAQASHIMRAPKDRLHVTLQVKAEFNSKINSYAKDTSQLSGITPLVDIANDGLAGSERTAHGSR